MSKGCGCFSLKFTDDCSGFGMNFRDDSDMSLGFGQTQVVHTDNYNDLYNKPSINEVELKGNKTFEDLGDHMLTNIEIKQIYDRVFKEV